MAVARVRGCGYRQMMTEPPRIAIWSANWVGNLGDYAIIKATRDLLARAIPDVQVAVSAYDWTGVDAVRTERFLESQRGCLDTGHSVPFVFPDRIYRLFKRLGQRRIANAYLYHRGVRRLQPLRGSHLGWCGTADAMLLAGGGHWGWDVLSANLLAQIDVFHSWNRPVWLLPHSMERGLTAQVASRRARRVLERPQAVLLRDRASLDVATALGLNNAELCPDSVFGLQWAAPETPRTSPRKNSLLALRGTGTRCRPAYMDQLGALVRSIRACGSGVAFFTTCDADDAVFLDLAARRFPDVPQIRPLTIDDAVARLAEADLVVTNRFHCMAFAMLAGTAVLPIADVEKVRGMCDTVTWPAGREREHDLGVEEIRWTLHLAADTVAMQTAYVEDAREKLRSMFDRIAASTARSRSASAVLADDAP